LKRRSNNPVLGHEHIPSRTALLQSVKIRTNRDGLRGGDIAEKQVGERRILFIGSSITLGWGVDEQATLTAQLERRFRRQGGKVRVLNAGIGNYNAERYIERFLGRLTHIRPDVVVVHYFLNDAEQLKSGGGNWLLRKSQLALTLWIAFNRFTEPSGKRALLDHYRAVYRKDSAGYKAMVAAFARLEAHAGKTPVKVVIAMMPDIHNLKNYPFDFIHQNMRELSVRFGFEFIDLRPALSGRDAKTLWAMPGDPHPSALGHRLMADALFGVLRNALTAVTGNR
jgi:lysophospholipase L1-like esterase